jgi:hypothetical protein
VLGHTHLGKPDAVLLVDADLEEMVDLRFSVWRGMRIPFKPSCLRLTRGAGAIRDVVRRPRGIEIRLENLDIHECGMHRLPGP